MRFKRKLWFRMVRKHKWKLLAATILVVAMHSLFKKITLAPSNLSALCEPIDVVYTWVNGSDPAFINSIKQYDPSFDPARYDDKNELKFSLRSLEKYAPWIRHIYIVTNGQIPKWLDLTNDRITIVPHDLIALNLQWLPTFSSAAIETFIHRIPNLSNRFLYLNDDIFLGTELYPEDLYTDSEGVRIYQAWLVPDCAEDCPWTYIGDGACDHHCNIEACQYDGGDCSVDNNSLPDNNSKERIDEFNIIKVKGNKVQSKLDIKHFPIKDITFTHRNKTFKDILTKHKNLSTAVELKNVVDTFNNHQQQTKLNSEKYTEPLMKNPTIEHRSTISSKDIYSQSLIYTNMLLNRQYGFRARNVLGHVGFLLEKAIVEAMQGTFYQEILNTAQHRFREPNDLQFAFAYYSFLMEEMRTATVREIFNELDTDNSLTWSDREIRTFLAKMFPLPLEWSAVRFFEQVIQNCSLINPSKQDKYVQYTTLIYERYEDSNLPTVTRDLVENCAPLAEALEANFALRSKYKFHIHSKRSMHNNFMMLTSNVTDVVNALDKIRRNPRKFNCINDNLESQHPEDNELIRHLLEDFYLSLFPKRSQFELKPQYRNRFDNWRSYLKWRRQQRAVIILVYSLSILIIAYLIRSICIHKTKFVRRCIQKL